MHWYKSSVFVGAVCSILLLLLNIEIFYPYLTSPFIQGWDGAGHALVAEYYAHNIFPSTWGWVTNWYAGMPFAQYYPPLFYFLVALLIKILTLDSTSIIKILASIMLILIPYMVVWLTQKNTKNIQAIWIAGISSIIMLSATFATYGNYGVTIKSTLNTGMFSHILSFIFLIFWLDKIGKIHQSKKDFLLASIYLSLMALSNAHMVFTSIIIFISSIIYRNHQYYIEKKRKIVEYLILNKTYLLHGLLSIALTSFWFIPFIQNYHFFNTFLEFKIDSLPRFFGEIWIILIILIIGTWVGIRKKNHLIATISLAGMVLIMLSIISPFLASLYLPAHTNRWLAGAFGLLPIVWATIYSILYDRYEIIKKYKYIFWGIFVLIIFHSFGNLNISDRGGFYTRYERERLSEIRQYFKENKRDGLVLIESHFVSNQPSMFLFDSIIGIETPVATSILRESSITAQFITPVRNSFSFGREAWGFKSYLVFDDNFTNQNIEKALGLAWNMGIQSFLIRSKYMRDRLSSSTKIYLEKDFGYWQVYSFIKENPRAVILTQRPALFFGELNLKNRDIADYDWSRFNEILLYENASTTNLIYANEQFLDKNNHLDDFKTIIITDYKYVNEGLAFERLISLSSSTTLILIAKENSLFYKLNDFFKKRPNKNIYIFDNLKPLILETNPLSRQIPEIINILKKEKNYQKPKNANIEDVRISNREIHIKIQNPSTSSLPILLKSSYYPAWKRTDGQPIYMISPSYIFTNATTSFSLYFETPKYVIVGRYISLFTLLSMFLYMIYIYRKNLYILYKRYLSRFLKKL